MPPATSPSALDPRTLRVLWTILVVIGTLALLYLLRTVILVLVFAVVFAYLIFPLSILLVFLVLAAQYDSMALPLPDR